MAIYNKRLPSIQGLPPYTFALVCQIEAIAELAASPASDFNCTELADVYGALRRAARDVDRRQSVLSSLAPHDRRSPA
jgi:hypothetical protein